MNRSEVLKKWLLVHKTHNISETVKYRASYH